MVIKYCLIILFILNYDSLAQNIQNNSITIKGRVVDYITEEPIIGAQIVLLNTFSGAASDLDGNYMISNLSPREYVLECNMILYATFRDTLNLTDHETLIYNIIMYDEEEAHARQAVIDIKNDSLKIYLGGWPLYAVPLDIKNVAAKKYGVQYIFDGGCDPTAFHWDKYNEIIINHLNKIHGKDWQELLKEEANELYEKYREKN